VHGNLIIYRGQNGISGAAVDFNNEALFSSGNIFNCNRYKSLSRDDAHWAWGEKIPHRARYRTWSELRNTGEENDGRLDIQLFKSLEPECENMAVGSALQRTAE